MASRDREALRHRSEALARFDEWASRHPTHLSAAVAVATAGRLYDLLPVASRHRPIDPQGVITLHRLLRRAFPQR